MGKLSFLDTNASETKEMAFVNTFPLLSFRWMLSKEKLTNTCTFISSFVVVMSAEPLSFFYSHFLDSGWSGGTSH